MVFTICLHQLIGGLKLLYFIFNPFGDADFDYWPYNRFFCWNHQPVDYFHDLSCIFCLSFPRPSTSNPDSLRRLISSLLEDIYAQYHHHQQSEGRESPSPNRSTWWTLVKRTNRLMYLYSSLSFSMLFRSELRQNCRCLMIFGFFLNT